MRRLGIFTFSDLFIKAGPDGNILKGDVCFLNDLNYSTKYCEGSSQAGTPVPLEKGFSLLCREGLKKNLIISILVYCFVFRISNLEFAYDCPHRRALGVFQFQRKTYQVVISGIYPG
jgi:hypothetical protein